MNSTWRSKPAEIETYLYTCARWCRYEQQCDEEEPIIANTTKEIEDTMFSS